MIDTNFTLSNIEQDTIGEIMNISMGAVATALSTPIDRKVTITAPRCWYPAVMIQRHAPPSALKSGIKKGLTAAIT